MDILPITLVGDNLGKRHQYLNKLVQETYEKNVPFETIRNLPERSEIDRLFKIDLANKYKHVEYIIRNLKEEDMLFVSKALKCTWLLTYTQHGQYIITPHYLETELYPHMRTTASNKMKHWIHLHLKDETRSEEFYNYYKDKDLDLALKFLPKCHISFLLQEMKRIPFSKITPHLLKLLCERTAMAAKIYFMKLKRGGSVDEKFIQNIQFLLKSSPDIYFNIIEAFFLTQFRRLSKDATEYIMVNHTQRFFAKQQLYTERILDLPTLAKHLNSVQAKKLIISLAKAKYLYRHFSFDFKFCEPLTKRINASEKNDFCNKIFKQKQIGVPCNKAPYLIPPLAEKRKLSDTPEEEKAYDHLLKDPTQLPLLRGGGGDIPQNFMFEQLFSQYRFCSFETTFNKLQKLIFKESAPQNREYMFLVLISKSGGREKSVSVLLQWLKEKFRNEPITTRSAVVRSLIKRAAAWRLTDATWSLLLEYGHDLGLDGSPNDICREGLHGVVIRYLLQNAECPPEIWTSFIQEFSPLNEYSLNAKERKLVLGNLLSQLMRRSQHEIDAADTYVSLALDVLDAYKSRVDAHPEMLPHLISFVSRDPVASRRIQRRLFTNRVACQRLFRYYFKISQTDASYLNALRHDAKFLSESITEFETFLENMNNLRHEGFFRKLAVYFSEEGGLAEQFSGLLQRKAVQQLHWKLARPIAHLSRNRLPDVPPLPALLEADELRQWQKMYDARQQNAHLMRPRVFPFISEDNNEFWQSVWVHTCSPLALRGSLNVLLTTGRSARVLLALRGPADRALLATALPHAARARPARALRVALRLLRNQPCDQTLDRNWTALKSLLLNTDLENKKFELYCELAKLDAIPKKIQLDYCVTICNIFNRVGYCKTGVPPRAALPLLACILDHWKSVDELLIHDILKDFLNNGLSDRSFGENHVDSNYWRSKKGHLLCFSDLTLINLSCKYTKMYFCTFDSIVMNQKLLNGDYFNYVTVLLRVLVRFLYSSDSVWIQSSRVRTYLKPFLERVESLWETAMKNIFMAFLKILMSNFSFINKSDCLQVLLVVQESCEHIVPLYTNSTLSLRIRLIIIYYKAVQKQLEMKSEEKEDLIPRLFGELVANDLELMVRDHFQSLRIHYSKALECFIGDFFRDERSIIMVIIGLIKNSKVDASVVGAMIYNERFSKIDVQRDLSDLYDNLTLSLKRLPITEVQFFLNFNEDLP